MSILEPLHQIGLEALAMDPSAAFSINELRDSMMNLSMLQNTTPAKEPFSNYLTNLLTQECADIESKQTCKDCYNENFYKNIKAITQGYNIYKGNPLARIDEGYTGSNVYSLDWTNINAQGGSMNFPNDVNVVMNFGCSSSLSTSLVTNAKEYQKQIKTHTKGSLGAGFAGIGGKFTASSEYKKNEKIMRSGASGIATADAQCNLFRITYAIPPCLSGNLEAGLTMLPVAPSEDQMNMFIDTFGTHALKQVNMGAKFVATASFSKSALNKYESEGKTFKFSAEASGWGVTAGGSHSSSNQEINRSTDTSEINTLDQYTIGTTLPEGDTVRDKLNRWASDDRKIMAHPMPIGDMELIPLVDAITQAKQVRGGVSQSELSKLRALSDHIGNDKYCQNLLRKGLLSSCEDPQAPAPYEPEPEPSVIHYDDKNYVFDIREEPYHNWDFQGDDVRNKRYCHGMVGASKGAKSGNQYNHHLQEGYFTCDSSLVKGLPGSDAPKCWCNPNYEWNEYTKGKPSRKFGALGNLAYENWTKQGKLNETRVCNGIIAISDRWQTWSHRYQNALVAKVNGKYKCSYSAFQMYDWMSNEDNTSWLGGAYCYCNQQK